MKKPTLFVDAAPGIRLAVHTWGQPPTATQPRETLLLLHGFPDRAVFWEKVAAQLSASFYVVAYDMRGCGDSTPITGRRHYHYTPLINDLYAVIKAVSPTRKVHLVGHDWGALYGWDAIFDPRAARHIASFVTMAPSLNQVGHWMRKRLLHPSPGNLGQLLHQAMISNGLMTFFTLPILPELMWRSGVAMKMFHFFMKRFEHLPYEPLEGVPDDAIRYLGIYRANLLQQVMRPQPVRTTPIPVHTLIATRDPFLPPRVFEGCRQWATRYSESHVDAAHWAPLSQPVALAHTLADMARAYPACTPQTA
ncbi:MAG TPA: alpha/beta fold hydrolase [Aquabacterium sp.]|uniref:alpha/beta fold hydrolase n=1 Tax=Aquabacterium sp. TaxID=1872578 RepID=UPI002E322816|nr:alpha/beta fold hydrolase [Aquabacterium sp.]HEX5357073.1 alpha/beta fold hydrolase [Aquabacterium sp.]